jgi:hypothetical protein
MSSLDNPSRHRLDHHILDESSLLIMSGVDNRVLDDVEFRQPLQHRLDHHILDESLLNMSGVDKTALLTSQTRPLQS